MEKITNQKSIKQKNNIDLVSFEVIENILDNILVSEKDVLNFLLEKDIDKDIKLIIQEFLLDNTELIEQYIWEIYRMVIKEEQKRLKKDTEEDEFSGVVFMPLNTKEWLKEYVLVILNYIKNNKEDFIEWLYTMVADHLEENIKQVKKLNYRIKIKKEKIKKLGEMLKKHKIRKTTHELYDLYKKWKLDYLFK